MNNSSSKDSLDLQRLRHPDIDEIRMSCMNVAVILEYFAMQKGISKELLLEGVERDEEFLENTSNWVGNLDAFRLFRNAHRSIEGFSHRDWFEVGSHFHRYQASGYFKVLFRVLSLKMVYQKLPHYNQRTNKISAYEIIEHKGNSVRYAWKIQKKEHEELFTNGMECYFHEGILASIPRLRNSSAPISRTTHEICSRKVHLILRALNPGYERYLEYNSEGASWNGSLFARWVRLDQKNGYYTRQARLSTRDSATALKIDSALIIEGNVVFNVGEIYNAPYCVIGVNYQDVSLWDRIFNRHSISESYLEDQLRITEEKFREAELLKRQAEQARDESERRLQIMQLYTRRSLVQEIKAGGNPAFAEPQSARKAVLFSDIKSFMELTDSLNTTELISFLNGFFQLMSGPILANGGEIDKLIGDAVMAVFDTPEQAVKAGLEMMQILQYTNRDRVQRGLRPMHCGIGVTYGDVILANVGCHEKMDSTLIGDVVNVSFRLEAMTRRYGLGMLVSKSVFKNLNSDRFQMRFVDSHCPKGKKRRMEIYEVFNHEVEDIRSKKLEQASEMEEAWALLDSGEIVLAKEKFMTIRESIGSHRWDTQRSADPLVDYFIEHCERVLAADPNTIPA